MLYDLFLVVTMHPFMFSFHVCTVIIALIPSHHQYQLLDYSTLHQFIKKPFPDVSSTSKNLKKNSSIFIGRSKISIHLNTIDICSSWLRSRVQSNIIKIYLDFLSFSIIIFLITPTSINIKLFWIKKYPICCKVKEFNNQFSRNNQLTFRIGSKI